MIIVFFCVVICNICRRLSVYMKKRKDDTLKTYLKVVEGYRDIDGKNKMRTIKSYGCPDDQNNPVYSLKIINPDSQRASISTT